MTILRLKLGDSHRCVTSVGNAGWSRKGWPPWSNSPQTRDRRTQLAKSRSPAGQASSERYAVHLLSLQAASVNADLAFFSNSVDP